MKWYSVKKYEPSNENYIIIRKKSIQNGSIDVLIGQYTGGDYRDMDDDVIAHPWKVTHFCLLDPIEIEE